MSECKMCGKLNPTTDCYSCLIEHFENHVEDLKKERDELKARVEELEEFLEARYSGDWSNWQCDLADWKELGQ